MAVKNLFFNVIIVFMAMFMMLSSANAAEKAPVKKSAPRSALAERPTAAQVERPSPKPSVKHKVASSPSSVLARVNGENITLGQLNRYMDMMVLALKNRRKNCTEDDVKRFKRKNFEKFSNDLLVRTVVRTGLAASNLVVTAAVSNHVESGFLRSCGAKGQTLPQLKQQLGKAGFLKDAEAMLQYEMRLMTFMTTVYSNRYFVSDKELANVKEGLRRYNLRATATNEFTLAKARRVVDRAKKGEDFGKLADEFTMEKSEPGGDLGDCDESDFVAEEQYIWKKLMSMKEGDVSEVFETDDGYAVYKVVKRNTAEESNTGDFSIRLAKIFFRRAYLFPEQTDEELRVDVEKENRDKLSFDIYKAFRAQSKIEYPEGHLTTR